MTYTPYAIPISVKGIVFEDGKVWLRKNERNEWELPGGKLDEKEQPVDTVRREMQEELGFDVIVQELISADVYTIEKSVDERNGVLVLSYKCEIMEKSGSFEMIGEAGKAQFDRFSLEEVRNLHMPQFYKDAIVKASKTEK